MFFRHPLTHLDRWHVFFTKCPRDYQCCQTNSESLYPARLSILSPEVQCPVSRYSTSFQSCAPLLPVQVQALNPTAASLEELRNFPFANDDATIANLAQELPLYLAASDGVTVTCEDDKLTWWANHKDTLPHWSSLVKISC